MLKLQTYMEFHSTTYYISKCAFIITKQSVYFPDKPGNISRSQKRERSLKTCLCPSWAPVAHVCNPSYLGSWDQEDGGLRPTWPNSLQDSISKITREKWTGGVAQVIELLLCKCEVLSSSPNTIKKKICSCLNWTHIFVHPTTILRNGVSFFKQWKWKSIFPSMAI
jgi:hypothetical protein